MAAVEDGEKDFLAVCWKVTQRDFIEHQEMRPGVSVGDFLRSILCIGSMYLGEQSCRLSPQHAFTLADVQYCQRCRKMTLPDAGRSGQDQIADLASRELACLLPKLFRRHKALSFFHALAANVEVVQSRMAMAFLEVNQYLDQTTVERANNATSVGIRMQFYVSAWAVVVQHIWMGVGSIDFPALFQEMNAKMGGATNLSVFTNPHNEYIYILATKGLVGLTLYLAIFAQACRMAIKKENEVQRIGLLVFVFLFMLSITTNSMMIDMEEGHFTMLVLLIFLAPKSLDFLEPKAT